MPLAFDLSGRLFIALEDADGRVASLVRRELDPFPASGPPETPPDVVLRPLPHPPPAFCDLQNPARDGLVTASDGARLWMLAGDRACSVPDPIEVPEAVFEYEPGFPLQRMFRTLVRPVLQLALPRRGAVAAHAAAVELEGVAVLVAGWSESGKTETALALVESGAAFLSDKWTIVGADGEASAFPVSVGVRRWVLPHLPRLAGALPRTARRRLMAARLIAALAAPVRSRAARVVQVADRAALTPTQLRAAYGQRDDPARRVPVEAVALLTNVPEGAPTVEPADPDWAAARLARSAAYERRDYLALLERRAFAFPAGRAASVEAAIAEDRALLQGVLEKTRVLEVRTPFPTDPRPVAAAIARCL